MSTAAIENRLDEALEEMEATSLMDMAKSLGLDEKALASDTSQSQNTGKGKTNTPRGGGGKRGRGGGRGGKVTASLHQASSAITGMMKKQTDTLPTDTDIMEKKVDEMSEVSERLEVELEKEKRERQRLEQELEALRLSHNTLATQFVQLSSRVEHISKGNGATGKKGAVPASVILGENSASSGTEGTYSLPPPPPTENTNHPSSRGVARGRRRGGL